MVCGPFMPRIRSPRVVPVTTVGLLAWATEPARSTARTAVPRIVLEMLFPVMPSVPGRHPYTFDATGRSVGRDGLGVPIVRTLARNCETYCPPSFENIYPRHW